MMSLPDDIRPGPDLYGLPWEAVIFTATLGLFTFLLFTCRFVQAVSDHSSSLNYSGPKEHFLRTLSETQPLSDAQLILIEILRNKQKSIVLLSQSVLTVSYDDFFFLNIIIILKRSDMRF